MITIRKTTSKDIEPILKIFENASEFMHTHGNPTQWTNGYPGRREIEKDISAGASYVCIENEKIIGSFALLLEEEPTYKVIENGAWRKNLPYGTIHRLASDRSCKGISKAVFDFCRKKCNYLRIDTHADNKPMQKAAERYGFKPCGIIHLADGNPRIAFDYISEE